MPLWGRLSPLYKARAMVAKHCVVKHFYAKLLGMALRVSPTGSVAATHCRDSAICFILMAIHAGVISSKPRYPLRQTHRRPMLFAGDEKQLRRPSANRPIWTLASL